MEYGHLDSDIVDKYRFPKSGYRVNVEALANELGLRVEVTDLPLGISGSLERGENQYTIKVQEGELKGRQQFTIAHELGHYAHHKDKIKDGIEENILYRSDRLSDKEEQEANAFAADLIMPRSRVAQALREIDDLKERYDGVTHEVLALAFGVSNLAMTIRLGHQA